MKRLTSFIIFLAAVGVSFASGMVNYSHTSAAQIKSLKITNKPEEPLITGSRLRLKTRIVSVKQKKHKIMWYSSNKKVATISSKGLLRALKKGKTKITAAIKDTKKKSSFRLTVQNPVKLKRIKITGDKHVQAGDTLQLNAQLTPHNATNTKIIWKSSKPSVAAVDSSGLVSAREPGKATITASDKKSKKKAKYKITVEKVPVTAISFSPNSVKSMETGTTQTFSVQIAPLNATNKKIKWSTSNKSAATVDENGVVTALRPIENVDITATSADNKNAFCTWKIRITLTDGFITKSILDSLDLTVIDKVMIVAHPDDETIWGGGHLLEDEYLVVCMSHSWNEQRRTAFINTMKTTNDKYLILNYPDTRKQFSNGTYETDRLSTCRTALQKDIARILSYKKWKQVITHNPAGEYGKYLHQQISQAVTAEFGKNCKMNSELWYFGRYYKAGNIPGKQIDPGLLTTKNQMINRYYPTASGAIKAFGHMIPYENWIPAADW